MSQRSPWIVLALLSLVGSLLAVSAAPAAAKNGRPDNLAAYSACVGPATQSARFDDVSRRSVAKAAIDCMSHYGIMLPTSPRMFSPRLGVTRQQMALFLIRAAGPAGIDIPEAADQGFQDIGDLPQEVQDAINQLVELRITRGTTQVSFTPDTVVNRRQMAQFLTRFLEVATIGEGGSDIADIRPDDDHFTDLDELPHDPYNAIRLLYELGITSGTTATTFSPADPVTRAQMAMFISRLLAHTNARPAGVTIQVDSVDLRAGDTVDLAVSVRNDDHQPVADATVDLFYAPSDTDAYGSDGRCSVHVRPEVGTRSCVIDFSDEIVDGDGNLLHTISVDRSIVMYAWTGSLDRRFDADNANFGSLDIPVTAAPANFVLTDDMRPKASALHFGDSVVYTFQLVDDEKDPIALDEVDIRIRSILRNDGRIVADETKTYETDPDGRVELSFRLTDPDPDRPSRDGTLDLTVLLSEVPVIDESAADILDEMLLWSDLPADPSALILEQASAYQQATDSGSGGRNRVTATLVDQYGNPVHRVRVQFVSNDEDGLGSAKSAYRKTTTSRGVASVTYFRESDTPISETIDAFTEGDFVINAEPIRHHWVEDAPEDTHRGEVVHHDPDRDTLVLKPSAGGPYAIAYDSNDQFNVVRSVCPQERLEDRTCPVSEELRTFGQTIGEFRTELNEGSEMEVVFVGDRRSAVNSFTKNPI